ncbi:peptidyl-dipeptidase Dcp [Gordonia effusa NBRC 100432]|uniref:Peptidyl-dipeptidase Dcp n=1 Tax=Gordonia effusa NBRC 100432 TaxID=1077974 RepID=H0R0R2_9ACTN|nr:M3 family metallopeptidase [Gordonia effusa]GAB18663.1 peptidyl-dipeptidase Dcp [Gordonia effusa NBRC 100432]
MPQANSVLAESDLPYGLPDFAVISDGDFLPAFDAAMAAHLAEVATIADNAEPATFANTIEALERSGQDLGRRAHIFFNLVGPDTNPQRNEIAQELSTKLAEHYSTITLNANLFGRIDQLYREIADDDLAEDQQRLLSKYYRDAIRAGAGQDAAGQQQMREISSRLAYLTNQVGQFILDDTNASAVAFDDAAALEGLGAGEVAAAARAAADAGQDGYLVALELPSSQAAVASLVNPDARQRVFDASVSRCARDNENNTAAAIREIVELRARRAELLGYANHAEYTIAEETAPDAEAVFALLAQLSKAAVEAGERELTRLADLAGTDLAASDVTYWLAKAQQADSAVPLDDFAAYCELDTVLHDGVFFAAGQLYGLSFQARPDLRAYHPDVRVWEVFDESGAGIGLYLGDYFARPSKRGGAWMNSIVDQSKLLGQLPVVVNVLNVPKPADGQPALLSTDQLTTLFHEFGHALHGLLSAVRYPSQSGTSVPRDFVEFPSQVNEMWALHPEVLANYARHHATGAPIPTELADAARAAAQTESAHSTIEYLAAAVLDLAWHRLSVAQATSEAVADLAAFERAALADAGLGGELIPPRYRTAYFNHIFAGGYSAGYYSYIWSEVLDAETEQWFLASGGLRRESGRVFADLTLSRGSSVEPIASHQRLLGRPAGIEPLLLRRGLTA